MGAFPGMTAVKSTAEGAFLLSQIEASYLLGVTIDGASRDTGNTGATTTLRPGLVMGQVTSSKKYKQYSATATDGTQVPVGILPHATKVIDQDAADQDQSALLVLNGIVKASALIGLNETARNVMRGRGFLFDDEIPNGQAGAEFEPVSVKTADYTVVAADNGKLFTTRGAAGAVVFTLPALARGLRFRFFSEANQNMKVAGAAADIMVAKNDLVATSVEFSTANEKIGGALEVRANDDASKWLVLVLSNCTLTVTA